MAVGFALHDDGEVRWISVGLRCLADDNTLGVYADWKVNYSPSGHLVSRHSRNQATVVISPQHAIARSRSRLEYQAPGTRGDSEAHRPRSRGFTLKNLQSS
jgi:hypothetical protein